jgi:hypothetical protein
LSHLALHLKEAFVRVPSLAVLALLTLAASPSAQQTPRNAGAPETFTANANVKGAAGAIAATIQIDINRYSPDFDRTSVESALKGGGYPAFLAAIRKAPEVGTIGIGDQKFGIHYAREEKTAKGRTITLVTDKPMFFVGGGRADAKPRAGYEVGAIQMMVDDVGMGSGTMAAAARIKPGPEGVGVAVDDYAESPIKLVTVSRKLR